MVSEKNRVIIMDLTNEDALEIKRLLDLKIADMRDKNSAADLIRKYINPSANYCMTCDPAVRQMFYALRYWAESNGLVQPKI